MITCVSCSHLAKYDWPHEGSDLEPDSRIIYGKLDNGFRYVFMPNRQLPKHFSVRLYVKAGSLMEEEHERGLAHFLEHMAFKGIREYPEDTMIQTLQHLGVSFGSHNNGTTSLDKTVYSLDFMDNSLKHLEHSLKIMVGIADGMLLEQRSIKSEIGVILAEKRDTLSAKKKQENDYTVFAYKGLKINERLPIGIESVIKSANTRLLRDFYKKWYRPERMILIMVGDLESNEVEARIKDYFSTFSDLSEPPKEPNLGVLHYKHGLRSRIYRDKELPETVIEFVTLKPFKQRIFNQKIKKKEIYRSIARAILNERIRLLAAHNDAPFTEGEFLTGVQYKMFTESWLSMKCHPEHVLQAVRITENELRKVFQFGFTDEEFHRFKYEKLSQYAQDKDDEKTQQTDDLIEDLLHTIIYEGVCTSDQWDYDYFQEFFENEANKEDCLEVFKDSWDMDNLLIYLSTNSDIQYTEEQLKEVYYESKKVVLEAPEEEDEGGSEESEIIEYHFGGLGEKGAIIDQCYNAELDCYQYKLSNNIRVNLKQTNYGKEKIFYRINFGNGMQEPGTRLPGITDVANHILFVGGIGQFSKEELFEILPEQGIEIPWIDIEKDVFTMNSSIDPANFEAQMNLICGYLMEPAYRSDGLKKMHKEHTDWYNNLNKTTQEVRDYLTNGHPDYKLTLNDTLARTPQEVKNWFQNALTESYMEISIVGDFDQNKVLESLLKTLGALPKRKENKQQESKSNILLRRSPVIKVFVNPTTLPKTECSVYWELFGCDKKVGEVIAEIVDERLRQKMQIELGECYIYSSQLCFDEKVLKVTVTTDPQEAKNVCELIVEIVQTIANKGIAQDELNRVIVAKLLKMKRQTFTNEFWLDCLGRSQENPSEVMTPDFLNKYYQELTLKEVNEIANKYLQSEKALRVIIVPEAYCNIVQEIGSLIQN